MKLFIFLISKTVQFLQKYQSIRGYSFYQSNSYQLLVMQKQSFMSNQPIISSLRHNGEIIGTVQKPAVRSSFLTANQSISKLSSNCQDSKIKLKSVSKLMTASNSRSSKQFITNKKSQPQKVIYHYLLVVFCDKNDSQFFKEYIQNLRQNDYIYKMTIHFVETIDKFNEIITQKMAYENHRHFALLIGQYSAVHYRKHFRIMDQILIMIDSQDKYSSYSYLMKDENVKYILYNFQKVDKILKNMNVMESQTPEESMPSFIVENRRKNSNKMSSQRKSQQFRQEQFNYIIQKEVIIKGSQLAQSQILPVQSNKQEKQEENLSKKEIVQQFEYEYYQQKQKAFENVRNQKNQQQQMVVRDNHNITFRRISSNVQSIEKQNIQDRVVQIMSSFDEELKKVAISQQQSKISSLKPETICKGKNRVSLPWYSKYMKTEAKKRKSNKQNENAMTADTEFYNPTKKMTNRQKISQKAKNSAVYQMGIQCEIIRSQ